MTAIRSITTNDIKKVRILERYGNFLAESDVKNN